MIKKSIHSLTGKLVLTIGTLFVGMSLLLWCPFIMYGEKEFMDNVLKYAGSFVTSINKSIHYGMLTNSRVSIQNTIESLGSTEGIIGIRILDSNGIIAYSSDKTEIGNTIKEDSVASDILRLKREGKKEEIAKRDKWTIKEYKDGSTVLEFVEPIYNMYSCYTASCHVHSKKQDILGVLETQFSLSPIKTSIRKQSYTIAGFGVIFVSAISVVLCLVLHHFIAKPVSLLVEGMKRVASGDLDYTVNINTKDEMGMLGSAFNSMTRELKVSRKKLENWTKTLEEEVAKKTEEYKMAQNQLIHTEKLASLGRMSAGIAHELNSPLTGIVTSSHLLLKKIPPENKQDREDVEVIIEQAERCSRIIKGLLSFSRATPSEKGLININMVLENTLSIVRSQAKFHNVKFVINMEDTLPYIKGDSSHLQQVFMNMIINAADAMDDRGTLTIATRRVTSDGRQFVSIEFTDTGHGIPEEHFGKLFEPFFTTKPVGKGTGLGLAVSYGIIKHHGGEIMVKSEVNKGTSFFIRFPVAE